MIKIISCKYCGCAFNCLNKNCLIKKAEEKSCSFEFEEPNFKLLITKVTSKCPLCKETNKIRFSEVF